jgi:hypothetical protein
MSRINLEEVALNAIRLMMDMSLFGNIVRDLVGFKILLLGLIL